MRKTGVLLLAGALLAPVPAAADPITVTAGAARVYVVGGSDPSALFGIWRQVTGPAGPFIDVNISGDLFDPQQFLGLCAPCRAGQTFNPSLTVSGSPMGTASATLGDYRSPTHRWAELAASGRFTLSAGSMILPSDAPDLFNVFLPLEFTGGFSGFHAGDEVLRVDPFSFSGTAHVQFRTAPDSEGRLFTAQAFDFIAGDAPAPVPEPATLILLGGGLTGMVWHRRRRRG